MIAGALGREGSRFGSHEDMFVKGKTKENVLLVEPSGIESKIRNLGPRYAHARNKDYFHP